MAEPAPFQFLPLGAIIQSFLVGKTNIVQGFPKQSQYVSHNAPYFGETIGRVANRIAGGKIESLNNKSYSLAQNNGPNSLHGGNVGWGKRIWDGPTPVGIRTILGLDGGKLEGGESVKFKLRSEDGEEGFPGTVDVSVVYTAGTQKVGGKEVRVLGIEYQVELVGEEIEETVVNVTNHSYFNLTNNPTIEGTVVSLCTNSHLPLDESGIPTGGPAPYPTVTANEEFKLNPPPNFNLDDCFVVDPTNTNIPLDTRSSPLNSLVKAYHPESKIHLEVLSTEPAFQFYTGKYIDVPEINAEGAEEGVKGRGARSGFCVEPSRYVNAVNVPEWRGQVVLKKGEVYGSRVVYKGWCEL